MHVLDLTNTTCSVRLPKGVYTAYLTAANTKYHWFSTESNPITFTIGNHSHDWQLNETTVATCIATGTKTFTCACGASYSETIPVNSSNHVNKTNVAATASTCTVKGYTGDQYCTTCKQTITKGSAVNALGHTSPDGNGNCTRCGQHIKDVTPSNPQPNPNACKYCGKVHTGPFGWLIKFFHSILAIFKR